MGRGGRGGRPGLAPAGILARSAMTGLLRPQWLRALRFGVGVWAAPAAMAWGAVGTDGNEQEFAALIAGAGWGQSFHETGDSGWADRWFLDGEHAEVNSTPRGLSFAAGPRRGVDADHAVLWTRPEFVGELMITFDYTRTDAAERDVNILYLHAQGTGIGPHAPDLLAWSELRRIPAMRVYFQNLQAWHLSFAAFANEGPASPSDYLRVRRYPVTPERSFAETEVPPTYHDSGLFLPGQTYAVTVLKTAACLFLQVRGERETRLYRWDVARFASEERGRIGLRHMHGRSAVYANLRVFQRPPQPRVAAMPPLGGGPEHAPGR